MLKVQKDSWHYRWAYNSWFTKINEISDINGMHPAENPGNLCVYMRQLLKPAFTGAITIFFVYGMIISAAFWLFGIPFFPDGVLLSLFEIFQRAALMFGAALWAVTGLVLGIGGLVVGGLFIHEEYYLPWKEAQPVVEPVVEPVVKEPGLIRQWITSFHEKTCPLLEIDEDDSVQP